MTSTGKGRSFSLNSVNITDPNFKAGKNSQLGKETNPPPQSCKNEFEGLMRELKCQTGKQSGQMPERGAWLKPALMVFPRSECG